MHTGTPAGLVQKATVAALVALVVVLATVGASQARPSAAVQDPERNATTPTRWHFWVGQKKSKIDQLAQNAGERVVDVNVDSVTPMRFSAVLVRNSGPYARAGGWSFGSEADVTNKINAEKGRLIDLEPFTLFGKRFFAYVWVKNSGSAGKAWHWNYDLTVKQVVSEINKHKVRLVDLGSYVVSGKRRYSYIGIANKGVDAKAWWWYVNVSPQFVQQKAQEHGARLIDVERPSPGLMTVIMQRNDESAYSRHVYDYALSDLLRFQASNGVRITDLERYVKNGNVRYAASLIENASAENRRIRSIWRTSTMANAPNGTDAWFGIYAKQVKGSVDVGLAHTMAYQPLSVLKLIPHLYVMDKLDKDPGLDLLDQANGISWVSPKNKPDEVWCPGQGGQTQTYSETLRQTLTRGLGESLNRAHEALVKKYGSTAINNRTHQLGLTNTNVYLGCPQPAGKPDWTSNRSTLSELGELFEHVDDKTFFKNHWQQVSAEFYGLMANWDTNGIKAVVASEAAAAGKSGIVNQFMASVTLNGKGGGTILPQSDGSFNGGRGFFGRLELPFRSGRGRGGSLTVIKTFVGGYFVDNFKAPCNEDTAAQSRDATCRNWKTMQNAAYDKLMGEPYRLAIRKAIATWPSS